LEEEEEEEEGVLGVGQKSQNKGLLRINRDLVLGLLVISK
jgi:hypothetical protein